MGIKLVVKGVEEVVILDEIRFSNADEFFEDLSIGVPSATTISVNWVEGVVFVHKAFPFTDTTIKEYIEKGRIYWSFVKYAPMEEYKKSVTKNNVLFEVRKAKTPILIEVAKELKKRLKGGKS